MMNYIWLFMILSGGTACLVSGGPDMLTKVVTNSARESLNFAINISASIAFWSGIMKIAYKTGVLEKFGRLLKPVVSLLFPELRKHNDAMDAISVSLGANLLGIGNASTPLALDAMNKLSKINKKSEIASSSMCTFVILIASGMSIYPASIVAHRSQYGSLHPNDVVGLIFLSTLASTFTGLFIDRVIRKIRREGRKKA